jgi:hypothetical protein
MSSATMLPELRQPATALSVATTIAGLAPSIHNTQPWRWRIGAGVLDLFADRRRQLAAADPDGRMLTLSCGAALHHAQVVLAVQGYGSIVLPCPDAAQPELLARLTVAGHAPVTAATMRLYHAIGLRCTDRRPGAPQPVDDNALLGTILAVQSQGCFLQPLRHDQVRELAAIVAAAQAAQAADEAWRAEAAHWTGGVRSAGTGVPEANLPDRQPPTTVPQRDFGRPGRLPVGDGDDASATYAILYGTRDEPVDWLCAGRALSAAWLTATDAGMAVMPVSAPVEVPAARAALRRLTGTGYPYLVLRLGEADDRRPLPPTPRLAPERLLVSGEATARVSRGRGRRPAGAASGWPHTAG